MTAIGWGKIILFGEHAVVYGYPALAAALDRGVTLAPVPTTKGGLRLEIPSWNVAVKSTDDHPVARCLDAIAQHLAVGNPALTLLGDSQIPYGEGLGSSAALAVAIARALFLADKRAADPATIARAANASEELVHRYASGVDVALAMAGGIGVFRRSAGLRPITTGPLRVLIGSSGATRSTAAMVDRVAQATGKNPADSRLAELGNLTDVGTSALIHGELEALGTAMDRAHSVLGELGVSSPLLDAMCERARAVGAYGAKLTGAGGGGSVIAVAPRAAEAAVLDEWRRAQAVGFVATIGSRVGA